MSAAADKASMRREMACLWAGVTPAWIESAGALVREALLERGEIRSARVVGAYLSIAREVPTRALIEALDARGQAVCVPRFDAAAGAYRPAPWRPGGPLGRGPHGALEPRGGGAVAGDDVDVWIVPGVAFDERGGRLGRGGGWFDRLLAASGAARVGIAFEFQIVGAVPADPWDAAVDVIVTERRTRTANSGRTRPREPAHTRERLP